MGSESVHELRQIQQHSSSHSVTQSGATPAAPTVHDSAASASAASAAGAATESTDIAPGSARNLVPYPQQDVDPLKFRPAVLSDLFLSLVLTFDLAVVGILGGLAYKQSIEITNEWAFFVVQILPIVIGTITATTLESMVLTLSRLTPFIRCARKDGDLAVNSIMAGFFPLTSSSEAFRTRNWFLWLSCVLSNMSVIVLGLKAALFSTNENGQAVATSWALYSLLSVYVAVGVYVIGLHFYLRGRPTGLRDGLDIITIADHLALFRHSNFLDKYEGTCVANRTSMREKLGGMKVWLGYWKRTLDNNAEEYWHGFGELPSQWMMEVAPGEIHESANKACLSRTRYKSKFSVLEWPCVLLYTIGAVVMAVGYVVALSLGASRENKFDLPISIGVAEFIFSFFVTFLAGLFYIFWVNLRLFLAITEPFVALDKGGRLQDTLLLNYTCSPDIIAAYNAAKRGHWQITRSTVMCLLQRFFPILVGASIIVDVDIDAKVSIVFSSSLSIATIIWLGIYVVLMPYEGSRVDASRYLPRDYLTIADLISWSCSSSLLRKNELNAGETGQLKGNPFDISTDGSPAKGDDDRRNMEARLQLVANTYGFGLFEAYGTGRKNLYTIGLGIEQPTKLEHPQAGVTGLRWKNEDIEDGQSECLLASANRFESVTRTENNQVIPASGPIEVDQPAQPSSEEVAAGGPE